MKPTAGHVTTRLQVVGLRSGAGVGVYGVPAGCKFMVRITLSHTHRRTHFDSQRLPFLQVLLCQSGPQKALQAFRDTPQKAHSLITATILGASALPLCSRIEQNIHFQTSTCLLRLCPRLLCPSVEFVNQIRATESLFCQELQDTFLRASQAISPPPLILFKQIWDQKPH